MKYNSPVNELLEEYRPVWALLYSSSVMRWDLETYMPRAGADARGRALADITMMVQSRIISMKPLIERGKASKGLTDVEKGVVRVLGRRLNYYERVPPTLIEELQRTTTKSRIAWREAKEKSDFKLFRPHLEKVLSLKMKEGERLAGGGDPYDALLDQGEEGLSSRDLDSIFGSLIPSLKKILSKVLKNGEPPSSHKLEKSGYDEPSIIAANAGVIQVLGMPNDRFRVDLSAHPFTSGMDVDDVRITTRFKDRDFRTTLYATIHESGHALYELQVDRDLRSTPIGHGVSSGFHESQSRFWENMVGRSREFVKKLTPVIHKMLEFTKRYDSDELYRYANLVRPSLIRVDADEITYNLHIALRYRIEKLLFEEKVKVAEIPQIWSDTIEELLGVKPKDDSTGSLQDIHWSSGGFASFPNYTVGNVIAGMCWEAISRKREFSAVINEGGVDELKKWLGSNIHRYGGTYAPRELQRRVFNKVNDTGGLIRYLETKYLKF